MGNTSSGTIEGVDFKSYQENFLKEAKCNFDTKFSAKNNDVEEAELESFQLYQTLGTGAFAKVILCIHKQTFRLHAMKLLNKQLVVRQRQIEHAKNEKRILASVNFPFLVRLFYSFQDNSNLYMILEFVPGGELFTLLRNRIYFSESVAKFYSSQILLALEYLHHLDIIYRDLKPENILISAKGFLKVADFGFAKVVPDRTYTLCGTPEYLAPEIITNRGYGRSVDWWAFGILIYEFVAGHSPFCAESPMEIYEKILGCKIKFPTHFSKDLKALVKSLVEPDLSRRFGILKNGVEDIKHHKWYKDHIDWVAIYCRSVSIPNEVLMHSKKATSLAPQDHIDFRKERKLDIADLNMFGDVFVNF